VDAATDCSLLRRDPRPVVELDGTLDHEEKITCTVSLVEDGLRSAAIAAVARWIHGPRQQRSASALVQWTQHSIGVPKMPKKNWWICVCCLLFVVCCLLFVVCCLLFVV
jgi:hypothetical protein